MKKCKDCEFCKTYKENGDRVGDRDVIVVTCEKDKNITLVMTVLIDGDIDDAEEFEEMTCQRGEYE